MVLDCSVTLAWFLADEKDPDIDQILTEIESGHVQAISPRVWAYEIHSAIPRRIRQRGLDAALATEWLEDLDELNIDIRPCQRHDLRDFTSEVFPLQLKHHGIGFFDTFYLELAKQERVPLASLDLKLAEAAIAEGVELVIPIEQLKKWLERKSKIDSERAKQARSDVSQS